MLSGIGLCDGLITRPDESYRLWCVVVCDLEKPREGPLGAVAPREKKNTTVGNEAGFFAKIFKYVTVETLPFGRLNGD